MSAREMVERVSTCLGSLDVTRCTLATLEAFADDPHKHGLVEWLREGEREDDGRFEIRSCLRAIARAIEPVTYLEIGTRRGWSLAQVLAEAPGCAAYCCDMWVTGYAGTDNPGPPFVRDELRRVIGPLEVEPRFLNGDSHDVLPAFLHGKRPPHDEADLVAAWQAGLQRPATFDIVTVHGDHSALGSWWDICDVAPYVALGGVIVFDDIVPSSDESIGAEPHSLHHEYHEKLRIEPSLLRLWEVAAERLTDFMFIGPEAFPAGAPPVGFAVRVQEAPYAVAPVGYSASANSLPRSPETLRPPNRPGIRPAFSPLPWTRTLALDPNHIRERIEREAATSREKDAGSPADPSSAEDLRTLHRRWDVAFAAPPPAGGARTKLVGRARSAVERLIWPRVQQQADVNAASVRLVAELQETSARTAEIVDQHKVVIRRLQTSLEAARAEVGTARAVHGAAEILAALGASDLLAEPDAGPLTDLLRGRDPVLVVGRRRAGLVESLRREGIEAKEVLDPADPEGDDDGATRFDPYAYLAHVIAEPVGGIVLNELAPKLLGDDLASLVRAAHAGLRTGGVLALDAVSGQTGSPGVAFLQDAGALVAHREAGLLWLLEAAGFRDVGVATPPSTERPRFTVVGVRGR